MSAEPESVQQARQQVNRLVEEIARLTESPLAPNEYFAEFLQRVLQAIAAPAGAVWLRTPQGNLALQYQINFKEVGLDQDETARESHNELLRQAVSQGRPQMYPPNSGPGVIEGKPAPANMSRYVVLLMPIVVERQVAGLIEVWQEPDRGPGAMRGFMQFLNDLTGFVAAYLKNAQLRQMAGQQQLWVQLEAYARNVHSSLNPREVGYSIVNEARRLLSCDRVSIATRLGNDTQIEAVSGADVIEKRSALIRAMRELCHAVLLWGEKLTFAGTKDDSLPPRVLDALDKYLAESNSKLLILMPLKDEREKDSKGPARSAMLVEAFEPTITPEQLTARLDVLTKHAAPALYNALELRRLPFKWILQPLANIKDSLRGNRLAIAGAIAGGVVLLGLILAIVPYPLRMEAKGKLLPKDRQIIYPLFGGPITSVKVKHGDEVRKGDELLTIRDIEQQMQIEKLKSTMDASNQRINTTIEQLNKAVTEEDRQRLQADLIRYKFDYQQAKVEYDIRMSLVRNPKESSIWSPINGTVVTFDLNEVLLGKTVKPGDPLMQVANVRGKWETVLHIPENHVGHIREALAQSNGKPLEVDLLVTTYAVEGKRFRGYLYPDGLGGEVRMENNEPALTARVEIDEELKEILDRAKSGTSMPVGAEVRAKVRCGNRSVGYVLFYELWEFLFERVLF